MSTLTDRLEFAVVLHSEIYCNDNGKHSSVLFGGAPVQPYTIATLASDLMKAGRRLHRLAEAYCNGFDHEPAYKDNERATVRLEARVTAMLAPYGITPRFGGDPRGVMITLTLPRTKRTNGWSGEGYCVPR